MSLKFTIPCLVLYCFLFKVNAQITVDFTVNENVGCGSLQASFCDNSVSSAGNIVAWNWDLCGVSSDMVCPGRIFGSPGTCTICLTVTDAAGNTATDCKPDFITVYALPQPDFITNVSEGCSPLDVHFTDDSSGSDGAINKWTWGLGGSCGVVIQNDLTTPLSCTYNNNDNFTVSLTVEDANGCTNTITKSDLITVFPDPVIEIVAADSFRCEPPFSVDFSMPNADPDVDYSWSFGNGQNYTGPNPPTVIYNQAGAFDVGLIAANSQTGCTDTLTLPNRIEVGYPVEFTYSSDIGCIGEEITFEDITLMTADSIRWDFGDGNTDNTLNPTHTYMQGGCYTIVLSRFYAGCTSTQSFNCIQINDMPEADYLLSDTETCTVPHTINFESNTAGNIVSWLYEFLDLDGNVIGEVSAQSGSFTFNDFGRFPVRLSVTDDNGCMSVFITDTLHLQPLIAAVPEITVFGCVPVDFTLYDNSTTSGVLTNWQWEIETPSGLLMSNDTIPTFTLMDTGCYDVKLLVINSLGCQDSVYYNNVICGGAAPVVNFEATPLSTCVNTEVFFSDLSTPNANEWAWDLDGDGEFDSFEMNPQHEYADTGYFSVTLAAFQYGCGGQFIIDDYIEILPAVAAAEILQNCEDPYTVLVSDRSTAADSIFYDFGIANSDSDTTSSDQDFNFTFPDTGIYIVMQIAHNFAAGCIDTVMNSVYITDPVAGFTISDTIACAPATFQLEDNSDFAELIEWSATEGVFADANTGETNITFSNAGTYNDIQLTITDINGCKDSVNYEGGVKVNTAAADFTIDPPGGCVPLTVNFSDNSSSMYSDIEFWEWLIMDSIIITDGPDISFVFDSVGVYNVSLTVTDTLGCQNTKLIEEAVSASMPSAYFEADSLSCTFGSVHFESLSGGFGLAYEWAFGDGGTSTEAAPDYFYNQEGVYSVCLTVTALDGCQNMFCRNDYVTIANPVAQFSIDENFASCPPLLVNLENLSQNADTYTWDFGDDSGASELQSPSHIYTIPGVYDVTLIVSSSPACRDTFFIDDLITLEGPVGSFSYSLDTLCVPAVVGFEGTSISSYDYVWDFGNGVLDTVENVTGSNVDYVYENAGTYIPNLILIDDFGCSRPLSVDTIELGSMVLDFMPSDTSVCDNSSITFLNLSHASHPINNFEWYFEGGNPEQSTNLEEAVGYSAPGNYDVWLAAENEYCRDTVFKADLIGVGARPVAGFSFTPQAGCEPLAVTFTDTSTISPGSIVRRLWDFGNGNTAADISPTHTFFAGDNQQLKLTVASDVGCLDSITQSIDVLPLNTVHFDVMPEICIGNEIQIVPQIDDRSLVDSFYWLPSSSLSCFDCLEPMANPPATTTYELLIRNVNGCEGIFPVTVDVGLYEAPVVGLTQNSTICKGERIQLVASGSDNIYDYEWLDGIPGLSCYKSCFNPVASPEVSSAYTVVVTNEYGCSSSASVMITVVDDHAPIAGNDRMICMGDTAMLSLSGGLNPEWRPSTGLDCVFCDTPAASPPHDMDYVVTAYTSIGCEIKDTVSIQIVYPEDIDAGENTEICIGSSIVLDATAGGTVKWSPAAYLNNDETVSPVATPVEPTMFNLIATMGDCILEDSVFVNIIRKTNIFSEEYDICPGENIVLSIEGFADQFRWIPGTYLSDARAENPLATPLEPIDYTVIAQLGSCEPDTATVSIDFMEAPGVSLIPEYRFFPGQSVTMEVLQPTDAAYSYEWFPKTNLSCSDCPAPTLLPEATFQYSVHVTDTLSGCVTKLATTVLQINECGDELISIPNIFSPNGDALNDELYVMSSTISTIKSFTIYDRWGGIVFEASNFLPNDPNIAWDGKSAKGTLPSGVYIYFLEAVCDLDGSPILKKGDITLLR